MIDGHGKGRLFQHKRSNKVSRNKIKSNPNPIECDKVIVWQIEYRITSVLNTVMKYKTRAVFT